MNQEKIWTKSFINISLVQLLMFVAFYTLLTTLPIYVIENLGGTEAQGGLVVTVMLLAAILVRFFAANVLDRVGKKRGLVISVAIFMVTSFLYVFMESFIPLLALRFFHGLSFGIISTATGAIAADIIPASRKGAGLGYFAMAMNLAVVLGPFIGLTLIQYVSFNSLFIILGLLMVVALVNSIIVTVEEEDFVKETRKHRLSLHDFIETRAIPVGIIAGLTSISYASVLSFISVFADSIGLASTASYFFLVFAAVMLLSRPYLGRSFDLKGPRFVIAPCLSIFAIGLIVLSFTTSSWMLLVAAAITGLGYGALLPSFQTMAIQASPEKRSSHATSTFFILYDLGIAIGSFVWGLIVADIGFSNMYLVSAVIVIIALGLFELNHRRAVNKKEAITDAN